MHAPKSFWINTILIVCHLINRIRSSILGDKTPFSVFYPKNNGLIHLQRILGLCSSNSRENNKLDPQLFMCFLGYCVHKKDINPISRKHVICVDVTFFENTPYFLNFPCFTVSFYHSCFHFLHHLHLKNFLHFNNARRLLLILITYPLFSQLFLLKRLSPYSSLKRYFLY